MVQLAVSIDGYKDWNFLHVWYIFFYKSILVSFIVPYCNFEKQLFYLALRLYTPIHKCKCLDVVLGIHIVGHRNFINLVLYNKWYWIKNNFHVNFTWISICCPYHTAILLIVFYVTHIWSEYILLLCYLIFFSEFKTILMKLEQ